MKKITHNLGRFNTFFKNSSLGVQAVIITLVIGAIAGTATVTAMVMTPNNNTEYVTTTASEDNDSEPTSASDSQTVKEDDTEKNPNTVTAENTESPRISENTQSNTTQSTPQRSSETLQKEPQPQTPVQPTYTDTYPFASSCTSNPQGTSSQIDSYGYNKCYSSSYTAYKVAQTFGTSPQNWGNPKSWLTKADNENIPRGTTPKLHSVGIQTTGGAGWSVWVEAVHSNGTIDFSYYNFNNNLNHGTQYNVNPSAFSSYIYFGE